MIQSVMECEKDYSVKKESLDRLKLSVFSFVLSLSHIPKMTEDQSKLLVTQLSSCLADDSLSELRLCVGSLLLKLTRQPELEQLHLSSVELNIWTSTLERHPKATKFFAEAFSSLLTSFSSLSEEFESTFHISNTEKLEPPLQSTHSGSMEMLHRTKRRQGNCRFLHFGCNVRPTTLPKR